MYVCSLFWDTGALRLRRLCRSDRTDGRRLKELRDEIVLFGGVIEKGLEPQITTLHQITGIQLSILEWMCGMMWECLSSETQ